jgi:hypothetical protein
LSAWTRDQGRPDGELLTMTIPIPNSLIQTVLLLAAITFMYLAVEVHHGRIDVRGQRQAELASTSNVDG